MRAEHELKYDATTGQVYKIWIVTVLLSILTLGIYRFWGKTRLRRYTTAGYSLQDEKYVGEDRFEYTGTGGELFWGFLKALFFLLIISIPFFWASWEIGKLNEAEIKANMENLAEEAEQEANSQEQGSTSTTSAPIGEEETSEQTEDVQEPVLDVERTIPEQEGTSPGQESEQINGSDTTTDVEVNTNIQVQSGVVTQDSTQQNSQASEAKETENSNELIKSPTYLYIVWSVFIIYIVFYVAFLPFIALFQAFKYRSSRLRFRGIRGHMLGSSIKYGFLGLFHTLLTLITLGLWKPLADLSLHKFKMNHLYFGSQQASFTAPYFRMFFYYFFWYLLFLVGILLMVFGDLLMGQGHEIILSYAKTYLNNEVLLNQLIIFAPFITALGTILLLVSVIGLAFGYRAALARAKYNHLTFGDIGFRCKITGYKLFKLLFGNTLIIILTLGIGFPWAMQRNNRFLSRNLRVVGDFENSKILQAEGKEDTSGEGLFSFFDLRIKMF